MIYYVGLVAAALLQTASSPADSLLRDGESIGRMVVLGVRCEIDGRVVSDPVGQSQFAEGLDERVAASGVDPSVLMEAVDRGIEAEDQAIAAAEVGGTADQYFDQACSDMAQQFPLSFRLAAPTNDPA